MTSKPQLTGSIGAIKLLDRLHGVSVRFICDKGGSFGTTGAVILHVELDQRSDALKETL